MLKSPTRHSCLKSEKNLTTGHKEKHWVHKDLRIKDVFFVKNLVFFYVEKQIKTKIFSPFGNPRYYFKINKKPL